MVASIAVAPTLCSENARATFCGKQSVLIELRHLLGDNNVDQVMCFKAEFLSHTAISNKNDKFYIAITVTRKLPKPETVHEFIDSRGCTPQSRYDITYSYTVQTEQTRVCQDMP